jgi:hypothetical protein
LSSEKNGAGTVFLYETVTIIKCLLKQTQDRLESESIPSGRQPDKNINTRKAIKTQHAAYPVKNPDRKSQKKQHKISMQNKTPG